MDMAMQWLKTQGLDDLRDRSCAETIRQYGWLRSVGSANPYLAIWARTGRSCREIEAAVANIEIVEVPAARGCTYYVPREDAALALRLAEITGGNSDLRVAEKHLGVTADEIDRLSQAILRALEDEPLDPRGLSSRVSEIRHLGEEGRKRGQTTTLSLGLSQLQLAGQIRRLPQGGRLDTERFQYAIWKDGPDPSTLNEDDVAIAMAERFARWANPATEAEFRAFTGLPARLTKGLSFPEVPIAESTTSRPVLLASLDPWLHLKRNLKDLIAPEDEGKLRPDRNGNVLELESHPIVVDGLLGGLWEYDPDSASIAAWLWSPDDATRQAVERTATWIREELGDFRSVSLDSPKSRKPRLDWLRAQA